jgi:hypothetical protein
VGDRLGDRRFHFRMVANTGGNREHTAARRLRAEFGGGGIEPFLIGGGDGYRRTLCEQRTGGGQADASRTAGDKGDLARKWTHLVH